VTPITILSQLTSEVLLSMIVDYIYDRHSMTLLTATTFGDKPMPKGINRVIEVDGRPQQREPIVPRDLVGAELREEHRFKADVDIDLLEQLLHHLGVRAGEFDGRSALELDLAPID